MKIDDNLPPGQLRERKALKKTLISQISVCDASNWEDSRLSWESCCLSKEDFFNETSLKLFSYQFKWNNIYQAYCKQLGKTPETITLWRDIPLVPAMAFKEFPLFCGNPSLASICYHSSGTTNAKHSCHYLWENDIYDVSLTVNFKRHLLPDFDKIQIISLIPSSKDLPNSSLAHMVFMLIQKFGDKKSGYYISKNGLDVARIIEIFDCCKKRKKPVIILGTSSSINYLLNFVKETGLSFSLPEGSRLLDTGGNKGVKKPIERDKFYLLIEKCLGIPSQYCVNEYGMSEMGSQFYDSVLVSTYDVGEERLKERPKESGRKKVVPPWVRTRILNPETLEDIGAGESGILCHYDLANLDSVLGIQTEDIGARMKDGFEIIGRSQGSEVRGCSLAIENFLSTTLKRKTCQLKKH